MTTTNHTHLLLEECTVGLSDEFGAQKETLFARLDSRVGLDAIHKHKGSIVELQYHRFPLLNDSAPHVGTAPPLVAMQTKRAPPFKRKA